MDTIERTWRAMSDDDKWAERERWRVACGEWRDAALALTREQGGRKTAARLASNRGAVSLPRDVLVYLQGQAMIEHRDRGDDEGQASRLLARYREDA